MLHSILTFIRDKAILLMALLLTLASCHKEAKLTPSPPSIPYQIPQGNQPYDQEILAFYNTWQTYILYKFDSIDFQYTFTAPSYYGYNAIPADTNYVQAALDFLHANWLDLYPASFLHKTMPFKILLASHVGTPTGSAPLNDTFYNRSTSSLAGGNSITFGEVNSALPLKTGPQIKTARNALQFAYWQQAVQNNMIPSPTGFNVLTNYATLNGSNYQQNGVLPQNGRPNPVTDLLNYIHLITSTDSVTIVNTWFTPAIDINGMYAQKYNLITSYYLNTYGIDLQAIGNMP